MIPIQEILSRIRWDETFGKARFTLGYFDRVDHQIKFVPFEALHFDKADHFRFKIIDGEGQTRSIPFHRVREIYRNGELIWQRPHPPSTEETSNA